jgi:hypothetical protein
MAKQAGIERLCISRFSPGLNFALAEQAVND